MFKEVYEQWRDIMDNQSDPRTSKWFMMSSPFPTIGVSVCYIVFATVVAPKIMANRTAWNAKRLQLFYNIFHLAINAHLFYALATKAWLNGYSFRCQPVDFSNFGLPLEIAQGSWIYYMSKFTDFFETIIFVLMKRFDMINLYHVAHHSIMPISTWWGVKFMPGGHSTFFGFVNVFVHIVLYSYFVITGVFPKSRKLFFWWKTFLPYFQIGQFAIIFIHAFQLLWRNDCNYPLWFVYFIGGHALIFYVLVRGKMRMDRKNLVATLKKNDNVKETRSHRTFAQSIRKLCLSANLCVNLDHIQ